MNILNLPYEILEQVVVCLDAPTLIQFGKADRRLHHVARKCLQHVRMRYESKLVEDYLVIDGDTVRTLDLSNCTWLLLPIATITSCFNPCRRIRGPSSGCLSPARRLSLL